MVGNIHWLTSTAPKGDRCGTRIRHMSARLSKDIGIYLLQLTWPFLVVALSIDLLEG